jgi:hypothetical protein|nr:MAG TPA: hypothetical protein [Caudoviricetes sp.]
MENMTQEKAEVIEHMKEFVHAMADALRNFVYPLDPTEGPEELAYIRRVMGAVDNVILTATMRENDPAAIQAISLSSDIMLQQVIEFHTKDEQKH